jgi:fatty-acyl-CoA synthase
MTARTLGASLGDAARTRAGFWHLDERGEGRFVLHQDLLAEAARIAGGLRDAGCEPGTRVALAVGASERFLPAFFGVVLAGGIVSPLPEAGVLGDPAAYAAHIGPLLDVTGAAILLADARTRAGWSAVDTGRPHLRVIDPETLHGRPVEAPASPDDDVVVQLSSGSTGRPKGVVLTHRAIHANVAAIAAALEVDPRRDVGVSWLPLHHDMGLVGMVLVGIHVAAPVALLPPLAFVKRPGLWLSLMTRLRGTVSFAPSAGYELVSRRLRARDLASLDLSAWRVAGCGAEPIDAEVLASFAARLESCGFDARAFTPCYGLAEHVLAAAIAPVGRGVATDAVSSEHLAGEGLALPCHASEAVARRVVSCGRPLPGHEIAIVDASGRELPERAVGEVVLSGPSLMRGYRSVEGEIVEPGVAGRSGRLSTGDLGYLAGGELHLCGRLKETIIRAGRNYDPHDIERTVATLPTLETATVVAFGTSPFGAGERVVVAIETREAPADLPPLVRRTVLQHRRLVVDEVLLLPPRALADVTTSGKPRRLALRDRYERGELAALATHRG